MNNKLSYFLMTFFIGALMIGCQKYSFDKNATGESIVTNGFRLQAPASGAAVVLNSATPTATLQISWSPASKSISENITYRWIAQVKGQPIDAFIVDYPSDNQGRATTLTLTQGTLDAFLAARGIPAGGTVPLIWSVLAQNGSSIERCTDVFDITVTRFQNGASPFVLLGPASKKDEVNINPNSTTDSLQFNWTRSKPGNANPISYRVWFASEGQIATPKFSMVYKNGTDTLLRVSYKQFSDSLVKYGYPIADIAKLQWTVTATSGTAPAVFTQFADFPNTLYIKREVRLYLVGGSTPADWSPPNSLRMIEDKRNPGVFYIYAKLTNAGFGLKFLTENTDWSSPTIKIYGNAGGDGTDPGTGGTLGLAGSGNITVPADGIYRVTADLVNNKYYLQTAVANGIGGMGMIGSFQTPQWNQPAVKMSYLGVNKFISITSTDMPSGGGFKFHDGNQWDNGGPGKNRWFGLDGTQLKEDPGPYSDIKWNGTTGPIRVIFDGTDVTNLQYIVNAGNIMKVVGNGLQGVAEWTPSASPNMTYQGNGIWTITLPLIGGKEFKFLAGPDWGAFDYEDAGGGKIKWDGGPNFKCPATDGTYTITLNEYTGTYTIL